MATGGLIGWLMEMGDRKERKKLLGTESLDTLEQERLRKRDKGLSEEAKANRQLGYDELAERTRNNKMMEQYYMASKAQAAQIAAVSERQSLAKQLQTQIAYSTSKLKPGEQEDPMITLFREKLIGVEGPMIGMNPKDILDAQALVEPYVAPPETLEPGQAASFITGLAPHLDAKGLSDLINTMEKATGIVFPELSLDQQAKLSDVQKIEMTVAQNLQKGGRIDEAALKQAMDSIAAGKGIPFDAMAIAPPKARALDALALNALITFTSGKEGKLKVIARQMTAQAPAGKEYQVVDATAGQWAGLRPEKLALMEYDEAVAAGLPESELKKFEKHRQTPADEKKRRGMETKAALEAIGVK